ncbi:MAG: tyrosine-type recombinase/integrase [bacterium]
MAIFKKQGVYWIDYYVSGRRKRERIGRSHKLAQEVLDKRKGEIAESRFFPERSNNKMTFRKAAGIFLEQHGKNLKSGYDMGYRLKKINEFMGDMRLTSITPLKIQELRNKLKESVSAARTNRYHALVKTVFNKAKEWRLFFGDNPASLTKLEKEPPGRTRFLDIDELKRLLAACDPRIYPVVVCAITTGMRRGEILNLRWDDLNLAVGIIYIRESKSGKPREIPIIRQLHNVLVELPEEGEKVFNVPRNTLIKYFDKAVESAGIRDFRFHDLRHAFASHFVMKTGDLPTLQKLLGHHSPAMTQRYAHLASGHIRSKMDILASGWTPIWTPRPFLISSEAQKSLIK